MTQDASASALGFYYQGCYALVALLAAVDDEAAVAVETYDDVVLETASLRSFAQLKHKASPLSIKSDDFWRAIANWVEYVPETKVRFRFVLTCRLPSDSILQGLAQPEEHVRIASVLFDEASRIAAASSMNDAFYKRRLPGCRSFLDLSEAQRVDLVGRLDIDDAAFAVADYDAKVIDHLTLTPTSIRIKVAQRLIEWWDRQVAMALSGKRLRALRRSEVLEMIAQLTHVFFSDQLPDDFADKQAPDSFDETPVLVRQIKLVGATPYWINQAKQERWRARGQRDSWLAEQFSVVERLDRFDRSLVSEWRLRFEPLTPRAQMDEAAERATGLALFEWAIRDAWQQVPPIHPEWKTPYLVRGTYQELANFRVVGWHPRYATLLDGEDSPGDEK